MFDDGLTATPLKKLSSDARVAKLSGYVGLENAEKLNKRFEKAKKSGTLANWEERTTGSKKLFENQKVHRTLTRLQAIDDLGVLNPAQAEDFMRDFVSIKLGIDIAPEEAKKISEFVQKLSKNTEKVGTDWTWENKKNVMDYFRTRKSLEDYTKKLSPDTALDVFTSVGARGSILFSLRSVMNSLMFQIIPGIKTAVAKRIVGANLIPGDYKKMDRIIASLGGFKPLPKELRKFWRNQTKMGIKIYKETGYDISRMQTLEDGFRYFGEKYTNPIGPTWGESKGIAEKMGATVRGHARLVQPGLKYAAGATDAIFGNAHRAGTSIQLSRQAAKLQEKHGSLPEGMTLQERQMELIKESLSFNPKSVEAQYIREEGLADANNANFTGNDVYGKLALKFRNILPKGLGNTIAPFAKIPANALGAGFEATGPGLIMGAKRLFSATRMGPGAEKNNEMSSAMTQMLAAGGILGFVLLLTSMLDNDDFIGAYDFTARSENGLTVAKNAGANYVRIGGEWINLRWTGPFAIPISAIMTARKSRAMGEMGTIGYAKGIMTSMLEFPVLKEVIGGVSKIERASRSNTWGSFAENAGLDIDSMRKWTQVRVVPSIISYDVQGLFDETKYDFMGRPIPKRTVRHFLTGSNIKEDTSNIITEEFDRLSLKGNTPTITDPTGDHIKFLEFVAEKIDDERYLKSLNKKKENYALSVYQRMHTRSYIEASPEDQKKAIDKIRREEILQPLREESDAIKEQMPELYERYEVETSPSSVTDDRGPFKLLRDYVRGTLVNPKNVARALFTKEKLGKVEGNLVELKRDYGEPYFGNDGSLNPLGSSYARREMAREMDIPISQLPELRREHILPVSAGGGNDDDNLMLIPIDVHNSYTPVDTKMGKAVKDGTMTTREVESIMMKLKVENSITVDEALNMIK
ncbi:MAG: hypothetical protein PF549_04810 [Patescibacteria group bacterium]|jgi:hypothetical protein|nr:hypothetical protein [Patescibacteria group bacterium]